MKLYKFRPLGSEQDLERAVQILERGFWCARFWELNDPMEGVYSYFRDTTSPQWPTDMLGAKSQYVICSFSDDRAFSDPRLWGYYANGFRGVAFEVDAGPGQEKIEMVQYKPELPKFSHDVPTERAVQHVLTTKLCCWSYECEYRYLAEGEPGPRRIGTISAIYFGCPYGIQLDPPLNAQYPVDRDYLCRARRLAEKAGRHGVACWTVRCKQCKVSSAGPFPEGVC